MFIHIIDCIYVYVHTTYMFQYICTCTYMDIRVHKFMNMYVHVCSMFRHVYTVLPYPVQGGWIPDVGKAGLIQLVHPSMLYWPADGQFQLLKGAEEDQVVTEVITLRATSIGWILLVGGLPPFGRR